MFHEDDVPTGEFDAVELPIDDAGNPIIPRVTDAWLFAMQRSVKRMLQSAKFRVDHEETFRPVPDVVRETVQSASGMVAAPTISSLYQITDGYELRWSVQRDGEYVPSGTIHLYGFAEVFGTWLHKLWGEHDDDAPLHEEDFTWEIRGFDRANENGSFQVVMHTAENMPTYGLFWHSPRNKTYRLKIGFLDYLALLTKTCGLHDWQYIVAEFDPEADADAAQRAADAQGALKELFGVSSLDDIPDFFLPTVDSDGDE